MLSHRAILLRYSAVVIAEVWKQGRSPCLRCVSDAAGVFAALKLCLKLTSAGTLTYLITTNLKMSLGLR
ncbi:hypothetical protein O3P69_007450 [Scylla paramamosain]|uniref:Secreted protein n=1 Tax=Scylla paramamosain TaxID=85552 RepID=A0AAW0V4K4_SCYPA